MSDAAQVALHFHPCKSTHEHTKENPMYHDAVTTLTTAAVMACDSCPIEVPVERFAVLVANGWGMQHTFQEPVFNDNQVISCRGHFSLDQNRE